MAFGISIPGRNVAANYAANFRPVSPVPGFSQVKSDLAANYLMQVPMLRQQMEMDMAKNALQEAASIKRLDKKLEVEKSMADDLIDFNKKGAILTMLAAEEDASMKIDPMNFLRNQQITDNALLTAALQPSARKNNPAEQLSSGAQGFSSLDLSGVLEEWSPILNITKSAKDYLKQDDKDSK
jgi:hypothetical protein